MKTVIINGTEYLCIHENKSLEDTCLECDLKGLPECKGQEAAICEDEEIVFKKVE